MTGAKCSEWVSAGLDGTLTCDLTDGHRGLHHDQSDHVVWYDILPGQHAIDVLAQLALQLALTAAVAIERNPPTDAEGTPTGPGGAE